MPPSNTKSQCVLVNSATQPSFDKLKRIYFKDFFKNPSNGWKLVKALLAPIKYTLKQY